MLAMCKLLATSKTSGYKRKTAASYRLHSLVLAFMISNFIFNLCHFVIFFLQALLLFKVSSDFRSNVSTSRKNIFNNENVAVCTKYKTTGA